MLTFNLSLLLPLSFLLLRLIVAAIFFSSGKSHAQNPVERGKSIGMSPEMTRGLGIVEMAAAVSVALGIFPRVGALLLMGTMIGAIYKKIFVWSIGFYEDEGFGWHYDLLLFLAALVIFATNGGEYILI